jgi:hypothetical protein
MRIGNWVIFERARDVEKLWEAVTYAEATLDRYRRANTILFGGRIEMIEQQLVEIQRRLVQEDSCRQLLAACRDLDRRLQRLEVFHADT